MYRGNSITIWRPVAVWTAVTVAAGATAVAAPDAWADAGSTPGPDAVADLLVAACTTGLALALAWLWLITTVTVAGVLTGRDGRHGGNTRRLVLLACGAAVVAGTAVPAAASGGDGRDLLVGLTLPERAVAPARLDAPAERASRASTASAAAPETYVVRPGDSLSSIALAHPGTGSLEERWRAIWHANRTVVGDDPDLIHPGQALHLPDTHRTHPDPQDGDRR